MVYKTMHDMILFPPTLVYTTIIVCVRVRVVSLHMLLIQDVCNGGCSFYLIVFPTNFHWPIIHHLCRKAFLNSLPLPFLLIYFLSLHSTYDHKNISYLRTEIMSILFTPLCQVLTKYLAHPENSITFCLINKLRRIEGLYWWHSG